MKLLKKLKKTENNFCIPKDMYFCEYKWIMIKNIVQLFIYRKIAITTRGL